MAVTTFVYEGHAIDYTPSANVAAGDVVVQADLVAMGCYGHGRARELVLGGATRGVLTDMHVPILMAH